MGEYQLYKGDCLDILPTLAAGSVDAVITDPPYGIDAGNANMRGQTWIYPPVFLYATHLLMATTKTDCIKHKSRWN